ncbi:D-3-phosphoglycerate dehydrogenase [Williamsia muralis]|uniref:D-3-phosphoglycerate dehydrogenase n=1 Tax=Williamsia marianensis TaxID=85044 RepID=A0A495K4R6_WILMA|nr:C-terminal binding protein [Williamsia muralis]RKR96277.1 D-3-phosphoglycerate dehydrogenase [Williamsia muralis]
MPDNGPLAVYTDTDDLDPDIGCQLLRDNGFQVEVLQTRDPDVIARDAAGATALLVGYAPIDRDLLLRLPNLKIVALLSRGHDNVDVDAAAELGIWVCTVGDVAAEEVATHAWTLTLALIRRLPFFAGFPTTRGWLDRPTPLPRRLSEMTVGVLGLGSTGRRYAALAAPTVREVLGFDIRTDRPEPAAGNLLVGIDGARVTDLDTVLSRSDVISLHLPLTDDTREFLGDNAFTRMRQGVHLINVARGTLIDSAALRRALDTGRVTAAALDVFDTEPPDPADPLIGHPNVLSTPHVAYLSDATTRGYIVAQAQNVVQWMTTGTPVLTVNDPVVPVP